MSLVEFSPLCMRCNSWPVVTEHQVFCSDKCARGTTLKCCHSSGCCERPAGQPASRFQGFCCLLCRSFDGAKRARNHGHQCSYGAAGCGLNSEKPPPFEPALAPQTPPLLTQLTDPRYVQPQTPPEALARGPLMPPLTQQLVPPRNPPEALARGPLVPPRNPPEALARGPLMPPLTQQLVPPRFAQVVAPSHPQVIPPRFPQFMALEDVSAPSHLQVIPPRSSAVIPPRSAGIPPRSSAVSHCVQPAPTLKQFPKVLAIPPTLQGRFAPQVVAPTSKAVARKRHSDWLRSVGLPCPPDSVPPWRR